MDRLNNVNITADGGIRFDFAHAFIPDFLQLINRGNVGRLTNGLNDFTLITAANSSFIEANERHVSNKLGINDMIYKLTVAFENAPNSTILREKLDRANAISRIISNFILSLIHTLYWVNLADFKKSTLPLSRAYNFAIDIGKDLVSRFEKRLNDEYNIANVLETEFGVKDAKKIPK